MRSRWALWCILLLGLAVRFSLLFLWDCEGLGTTDVDYDASAVSFLEGNGLQSETWGQTFRPPLYPLFLAGIYKVCGHSYTAVRVVQSVLGVLTVLVGYRIAVLLFGEAVALLSALCISLNPRLIYYAWYMGPTSLFTFLLAGVVLLLLESQKGRYHMLLRVGAGVTLGLAALCRPAMIYFGFLIPVWLFVSEGKLRGNLGLVAKKGAQILLVMLVVMIPWALRNYDLHGELVFTSYEKGYGLWIAHNPATLQREIYRQEKTMHCYYPEDIEALLTKTERERDAIYTSRALSYIRERPAEFLLSLGVQFVNFWRPMPRIRYVGRKAGIVGLLSFGVFLPFILLGMVLAWEMRRKLFLLYALIGYFTAVHIPFAVVGRYRDPIMPYLLMFSSYALLWVWGRFCLKTSFVTRSSEESDGKDAGGKCPEATPKRVVEDIWGRGRRQRVLQPIAVGRGFQTEPILTKKCDGVSDRVSC